MFPARPPAEDLTVPSTVYKVLQANREPTYVATFNVTGKYLFTAGADRCIHLWNAELDPSIDPTAHHLERPRAPSDTALGRYGAEVEQVYVCDSTTRSYITSFTAGHNYEVLDLAITPDATTIISVGGDTQATVWDVTGSKIRCRLQGHTGRINSVSLLSPFVCVTASADCTARVWDLRAKTGRGSCVQTMGDAADSVSAVAVGDKSIICGSLDGCVYTYDVRAGARRADHVGAPVTHIVADSSGASLLVQTNADQLLLLDQKRGGILARYSGHKSAQYTTRVCFLRDEAQVASGSTDGVVRVWDAASSAVIARLDAPYRHNWGNTGDRAPVGCVAAHPDGKTVAATCYDGAVTIWK